MGLFSRLKMGAVLTKDSALLIRHNPGLLAFPVVSGVAGIGFLALFLGVTFGLAQFAADAGLIAGLFLAYLALTFVSSFFAAGLVHQTRAVLAGREPSLRAGMAAAWERKGPLFVWSLIAATVGIVINAIENSDSRIGRILGVVFGVAWTLMTFFIIPVIVFERTSTVGMFKESARKFKQTYGETPVSLIGIQLLSAVIALPFILLGVYFNSIGLVPVTIGLVLLGVVLSFILTQTLQGVVKTALYFYAEEGKQPDEFDNVDFENLDTDQDRGLGSGGRVSGGGFR
jgi:hypothetical protein